MEGRIDGCMNMLCDKTILTILNVQNLNIKELPYGDRGKFLKQTEKRSL